LQRLLGHASLEMTRRYCQLADIDVKRVHNMASPVDNLDFTSAGVVRRLHTPKARNQEYTAGQSQLVYSDTRYRRTN
jgi:hypothetical protein